MLCEISQNTEPQGNSWKCSSKSKCQRTRSENIKWKDSSSKSYILFRCTADGVRDCKKSLGNADGVKRPKEEALFEFIPVVGTRIIWPKSRDIGISYCRMLLHDTMLNKDSYRTGTSDTASCECGEDEETVVHMLSYCSRHSHARTQLNFTLDRQRTHGQLVTKPGFFWHHHLKTTLVRETISF